MQFDIFEDTSLPFRTRRKNRKEKPRKKESTYMGLKSEITTIMMQVIEGPFVTKILGGIENEYEPIVAELRKLEVDHELPTSFPALQFPSVTLAENWFHSHVTGLVAPLPLRVRRKIHDQYGDMEDLFRADNRGQELMTELGIPWDSDLGRLIRLFVRNVQTAAKSALSPQEKRVQELENLVEQVTKERDEKTRALDVAAEDYNNLYRKFEGLESRFEQTRDSIRTHREAPPQPPHAPPHAHPPSEREVGPPLSGTQLALAQLLASVYEGREVEAREARWLARRPFSSLYKRLYEEDILDEDPDKLWAEQLAMLCAAFERSSETVNSLQRKTRLSADAIAALVAGRATQGSHVNSVVRVCKELNVYLAGITSVIEKSSPAVEVDTNTPPYDHSDHNLH